MIKFEQLNLISPLLKAVYDEGYEVPTPIQEQTITHSLNNKDILGCAQTGTGKTAAFALPILQLLSKDYQPNKKNKIKTRALILTPTRELALQIDESFKTYGKLLPLRETAIFGGVSQQAQMQILARGVDILTATPGRLLDLCNQKLIDLSEIEFFVLDEADRMLDMGFIHDVNKIIELLPAKRQTMLFSATMPKEIMSLAQGLLQDPVLIEITPSATTVDLITQKVYLTDRNTKRELLCWILKNDDAKSALVFARTKHGADRVAKELNRVGITARSIHGDKSQSSRQLALSGFKYGDCRVLVATDIAARGIDIDELALVINYDLPNMPETYVHRIGRTGRAGASGTAISFCDCTEIEYLEDIEKLISKSLPRITGHPYPMTVFEMEPVEKKPRPRRAPLQRNSFKSFTKQKPHK